MLHFFLFNIYFVLYSLEIYMLLDRLILIENSLSMQLIYDTIKSGSPGTTGFEDCIRFFPPEMFSGR